MKKIILFFISYSFFHTISWACYLDVSPMKAACEAHPYSTGQIVICLNSDPAAAFLFSHIGCEHALWPVSIYGCYQLTHSTWLQNYLNCPGTSQIGKTISLNQTNNACIVEGSKVTVDSQVLSESINLTGINFPIVYSSDKQRGYKGWYEVRIPVTSGGFNAHSDIFLESLSINIAGKIITQSFTPVAGLSFNFHWDGLDVDGDPVYGSVPVLISVEEKYVFPTVDIAYSSIPVLPPYGASKASQIKKQQETIISMPVNSNIFLGTIFSENRSIGGWDFSVHHRYDPVRKVLYLGDGSTLKTEAITRPNGDLWIVSADRSEVYVFDSNLYHIKTKNALTGVSSLRFDYNPLHQLTKITDSYENETTIQYSGNVVTSITSPYGQVTQITTDSNGFITSITNPAFETHEMTYSGDGLLQTFKKPNGIISTMSYDVSGNLLSDVSSAGQEVNLSKAFTETGYVITKTSAEERTSTHTVEAYGNNYKRTDSPNGQTVWTSESNKDHTIVQSNSSYYKQEIRGDDPRFGSLFKLITSVSGSNGSVGFNLSFSESPVLSDPNNPFSLVSMNQIYTLNGKNYLSSYTASTKTLNKESPEGIIENIILNNHSGIASYQFAGLLPVNFEYDLHGRPAQVSQGSRVSTLTYNSGNGLLASVTNPLSETTHFSYDTAGRIINQTLPDARVISYTHDSVGNVTSITPPGRLPHTMTSTGFNALESYLPPTIALPASPATFYTYNNDKQITQIDRPDLQTVTLNYDSRSGNLLNILSLSTVRSFFYNSIGQLYMASSEDSLDYSVSYNGANIISSEGIYGSSLSANLYYQFDSNNMTTSDTLTASPSAGSFISYSYNDDSLMTTAGNLEVERSSTTGFINQLTLASMRQHFTYSSSYGELNNILAKYNNTTNTYQESITRDVLGRVLTKTEQYGAGGNNIYGYSYDSSGRLTAVTLNSSPYKSFSYDSNSNRISETIGGITTNATYDDQDRLLTFGAKTYTYNDNGEVSTKLDTSSAETTTYLYNVFGNLKSVETPGKVVNYKVDAYGRRIVKLEGATIENYFIWNFRNQLLASANADGTLNSRFVYGSKAYVPDYMIKDSIEYMVVTDHLGSPVQVINSTTGAIAQEVRYDEWGNILSDTNPGFTPFGFAGCLYDQDTKLCRFGARDYDASIGRWLSKDPILFAGGDTNLYGYVMQDPINLIDRTGKFPVPVVIIGLAGVANAIGSGLGTYLAGGNSSDIISSAASGFVSGALTGASALGALYFGIPGGAAAILTGVATNTATSLIDATDILGKDLPQGHMDFSKKACQ